MKKNKINSALLLHFVSIVMIFESIFMLVAVGISFFYRETIALRMLLSFGTTMTFGLLLNALTYKQQKTSQTFGKVLSLSAWGGLPWDSLAQSLIY